MLNKTHFDAWKSEIPASEYEHTILLCFVSFDIKLQYQMAFVYNCDCEFIVFGAIIVKGWYQVLWPHIIL